jgi:hypothetical protein
MVITTDELAGSIPILRNFDGEGPEGEMHFSLRFNRSKAASSPDDDYH